MTPRTTPTYEFEGYLRSGKGSEAYVLTMRVTAALATLNNVEIEVSASPREASSYSPRTRTKSVTRLKRFFNYVCTAHPAA